ncbi:MAG: efflux RND transporter periplasmic adaptor subunit [Patescibacteria group bacterium]|nr:efflux RND transporter periplasmic adaptor subunit [Patescibacteria group bacterium]MDD4610829.1 efflux RND transporter periplasmic adaptor subunit [Patescibacteria group bacterium]
MIKTKKKIIIIILVALIVIIAGYFIFNKKPQEEYTTEKVKKGELIQSVSETGSIKAAEKIDLNFLVSGKVAKLSVNIGDKVIKDQILAELDNRSYVLKEKEAYANYLVAQANLNKLFAGATVEELGVSQTSVSKAKSAYYSALDEQDKTEKTVSESIEQAKNKLADLESTSPIKSSYRQAVENKKTNALTTIELKIDEANAALDNINTILKDTDAEDTLSVLDTSYLANTKLSYNDAKALISPAQSSLAKAEININEASINQAANDCVILLNKTYEALNYCYKSLEKSITSSAFLQTELDVYKTTISTNQNGINTAIAAVQSAKQNLTDAILALDDAIKTAKNSLTTAEKSGEKQLSTAQTQVDGALKAWDLAKAQLNQTEASPRSQDISLYQAQLTQAEAAWEIAKKQVEDSIIKAPIDGVVTESNYKIGEQVNATENVLAMVGNNDYEVKIDISEADIYKVKVGDLSEITLDAFGEDVKFSGEVAFVEPAETVIQDVVYYKVTIRLVHDGKVSEEYYNNIKPGMTANAVIITDKKENALFAPARAIIEKNGNGSGVKTKLARVLKNGKLIEVPVKTGLKGDSGMIEILEGLNEGDEVVTYVKESQK